MPELQHGDEVIIDHPGHPDHGRIATICGGSDGSYFTKIIRLGLIYHDCHPACHLKPVQRNDIHE